MVLIRWRSLRLPIGVGTRRSPGDGSFEGRLVPAGSLSLHPVALCELEPAATSYALFDLRSAWSLVRGSAQKSCLSALRDITWVGSPTTGHDHPGKSHRLCVGDAM
jgi:hypothetical protein